jgi:hypothetical protein
VLSAELHQLIFAHLMAIADFLAEVAKGSIDP